jgi:hypothetical protein
MLAAVSSITIELPFIYVHALPLKCMFPRKIYWAVVIFTSVGWFKQVANSEYGSRVVSPEDPASILSRAFRTRGRSVLPRSGTVVKILFLKVLVSSAAADELNPAERL